MAIMDIVINYIVPVVAGFFILVFISIFGYIIHRAVLKPLGVYEKIKEIMISLNKKKILSDEKIIEYCVKRIELDWKESDVRKELLLANKYDKKRIDQVVYAFNTISKEMQGEPGRKKLAEDLP